MFAEDSTVFFDDFAQPVSALGVSIERGGILDQPQEFIGDDGEVLLTDWTLLVRTADFGRLRIGDVVDVGTVRYQVRHDARMTCDGEFASVPLMRFRGISYDNGDQIDAESTGQPDTEIG